VGELYRVSITKIVCVSKSVKKDRAMCSVS
jgi:hypothetical protein